MTVYSFLFRVVRVILGIWHPVFRVSGRENIPTEGNFVICCNHSGLADPIWLLFALNLNRNCPVIMAKQSLMKIPVLRRIFAHYGVVGVKRGENDVHAVKAGLSALKSGKNLMLFPEGTRVKQGKTAEGKSGAILLAHRTQTPILPVYLQARRFPFSSLHCVIGKPYLPQTAEQKATPEELHRLAAELMETIYALGE